jgi:hypothetical protein
MAYSALKHQTIPGCYRIDLFVARGRSAAGGDQAARRHPAGIEDQGTLRYLWNNDLAETARKVTK